MAVGVYCAFEGWRRAKVLLLLAVCAHNLLPHLLGSVAVRVPVTGACGRGPRTSTTTSVLGLLVRGSCLLLLMDRE